MPASHDAARHRSTRSPVPEHQQATACVRVRSFAIVIGPASPPVPASTHGGDCSLSRMIGDDRQVTVRFLPDGELARPMLSRSSDSLTLVLGDDAETSDLSGRACMANALSVECDFARRTVRAFASIVGLPPLFLRRSPGKTQLTSDISLLAQPGERLELDQLGVLDLFRVGYPTEYRTLFKDVELAPGGHELRIDQHAAVTMRRAWRLPESEQPLDWPAFLDHQAGAFKAAIRNLDLSASFFALTGGLDTRAIFAALVSDRRTLSAATLTGPTCSLDARLAGALCRSYALPHHVVRLDALFLADLPAYVVAASRLSGGLSSLEKAGEIYFYRQLDGTANRELSGELGNQVGRQGFEGLSLRNADESILEGGFRALGPPCLPRKTLLQETESWHTAYQRLIQEEATLPQVGNVCVGQHFAVQQRPYASRAMLESLGRSPLSATLVGSFSAPKARWRDLRHRVLGEPIERSFQRKLISEVGGYVASCPINWGWRARGGVSLGGLALGAMAFADVVASSSYPGARMLRMMLRCTGTRGLHETKAYRDWLDRGLEDFVRDTLRSRSLRESGLFDTLALHRLLHEHYDLGQDRHRTIIAALDVGLAHELFCTA